jgi:hypothetical protein
MQPEKTDLTGIKFIDNIFFDHDMNRYGIISMLLLVVGILAGIAVGTGGIESTVQLVFLAFTTMASLSMILAVAPMRIIVYTSLAAILVDVVIIGINMII